MANSFMGMVYAVLRENNVDTSKMTPQECIEKFNELSSKENLKKEEIKNNKTSNDINVVKNKPKTKKTKESLGKINKSLYESITNRQIMNSNIVIPTTNIQHIKDRHGDIFTKNKEYIKQIINNPDFIFKGDKDNRMLVVKKIKSNLEIVLELSLENKQHANKIVSMWELSPRDFVKLKRKKKMLYKKSSK